MIRFLILLLVLTLPAQADPIWVADLTDDTDTANGTCNLREAITAANTDAAIDACPAGLGVDDIYFAKTGRIELITFLTSMSSDLNIIGPGADLLTIDGNRFGRILDCSPSGGNKTISISGLTLTGGGGAGTQGGGLSMSSGCKVTLTDAIVTDNLANYGGGIKLSGRDNVHLILKRTTISDNTATERGGGIYHDGLNEAVTIDIEDCTISGNTSERETAIFDGGGGLYLSNASLANLITITRTTISGNRSHQSGGGILLVGAAAGSMLTLNHVTITDNMADADMNGEGGGGGIHHLATGSVHTITMKNTIVSGNTDASLAGPFLHDIELTSPDVVTSNGHNLIGDNTGAGAVDFPPGNPNANGDYVGTSAAPAPAQLDPLDDYGGPTFTHRPTDVSGSNIIDRGSCTGEAHDQRGRGQTNTGPRIVDRPQTNTADGCDVGAVERGGTARKLEVDLKALLSGPYTNVLMSTHLNTGGLLPAAQPYSVAPWNYAGAETNASPSADMVDWVLVHLRKGTPMDATMTTAATRAGILQDNGDIEGLDESGPLSMGGLVPGAYYVVLDHRNHLRVMSAVPIVVDWEAPALYDFTDGLEKAYTSGGTALQDLGGGLFGLWGGDGDANGSVSAFDFLNTWLPINGGPAAYQAGDFDMNGSGTAFDFLTTWLPANGQASQVP